MKPNEGYEIGQEDLTAQLGLIILDGRTPPDVKSNIKDCRSCEDGLLHQRKEDFLSLWKSCDSMYIEVWLYCDEQFEEKEAMNGHNGYLLIEQWQIEFILNRSSDDGFHCTEKMLTQAIKSKLYFSQLSAWLSLTKGKFPRHTYFRLCQMENKTPLKRFIKPPDFHQFPRVSITPTKELVISLHSLPHSDILLEYPTFSWVLADLPTHTPQHKHAEKLSSNLEPGSTPRDECSFHDISQGMDQSRCSSHVARKLQFENLTLTGKKTSEQQQISCVGKDVDSSSPFETSKNIEAPTRTCAKQSARFSQPDLLGSIKEKASKYFPKEKQNLMCNKKANVLGETSKQEIEKRCLTTTDFDLSKNLTISGLPLSQKLVREAKPRSTKSTESFDESTELFTKSLCSNRDTESYLSSLAREICESKEVSLPVEKLYSTPADDEVPRPCRRTEKNSMTSNRSQEYRKNFTPMRKQCFDSCCDSEILRTDLDSQSRNCRNQEISRKSLLTRDICGDSEHCGDNKFLTESSSCRTYDGLQLKQTLTMTKDRKLKNREISKDKQMSNSECLETRTLDQTMKKSWSVDKYGYVLHRRKEVENILPDVRHVMEEEYERKLKERLRKCCLSNEDFPEKEQEMCKGMTRKTEMRKDNVFSAQECAAIPRTSNISRYHYRHASTGTLPVFHPSTGLPMSSSPAPFRKPSQKQTVDDICSPTREPAALSDRCGNLSRSAPTLTTQSLLVNFEESVLNDRLLPDGIVEGFTAELSASGSKKCLAHVTLPVQAYFFKLSDDNAPSPYMGYISLDVAGLPKKGYHVPKKGTIQLTLFNPSQTVVKVFVVLYDFSDMQPNFQTFLRQKTTSLAKSDGLVDRIHDNLHYLIHLRFASSKSGHIYLHTDIRVIFARHPPDQVHVQTTTSGPTNPKYVPRQEEF